MEENYKQTQRTPNYTQKYDLVCTPEESMKVMDRIEAILIMDNLESLLRNSKGL